MHALRKSDGRVALGPSKVGIDLSKTDGEDVLAFVARRGRPLTRPTGPLSPQAGRGEELAALQNGDEPQGRSIPTFRRPRVALGARAAVHDEVLRTVRWAPPTGQSPVRWAVPTLRDWGNLIRAAQPMNVSADRMRRNRPLTNRRSRKHMLVAQSLDGAAA
jgi:hypothetical protein